MLTACDLYGYDAYAVSIYAGNGYTDIDGSILYRPPVFALMIAISYWLFGVSHESSFWVIKAFCVANPIIVYAIGKVLFGKRVGFSAGLLVLTSYSINYWSLRHLDAIWPFFILFSTYCLYIAFEKNKAWYFVLSGISLALAYLVKEVALLFFPLPLLIFFLINDYRKKALFIKICLCYVIIFIVLLPWPVYQLLHDRPPGIGLILGYGAGADVISLISAPGVSGQQNLGIILLKQLKSLCEGIYYYYHGSVCAVDNCFILAPLFLISWFFVLFASIRGHKQPRILLLHILLFIPMIYIQGIHDMRMGQTIVVYLLSYLALAYFIHSILELVARRALKLRKYIQGAFVIIIGCFVGIQIFAKFKDDFGYKTILKKNQWYQTVFGIKDNEKIRHRSKTIADDDDFFEIVKKFSTPPNKLYIASSGNRLARDIYLKLKGRNRLFLLQYQMVGQLMDNSQVPPEERALYLKVYVIPGGRNLYWFEPVYKSQIAGMIEKEKITHILVQSGLDEGLDRYFSTFCDRIPILSEQVSIYHVISDPMILPSLPPIINIRSLYKLDKACKKRREDDLAFLKSCYIELFPYDGYAVEGGNRDDLARSSEAMKQDMFSVCQKGKDCFNDKDYKNAIDLFRQVIRINPDFAEAYCLLFYAVAIMERQKAILLNPNSPVSYNHFGLFLEWKKLIEPAITHYKKAISLDPGYLPAYQNLLNIYINQKRYYDTINVFDQLTKNIKGFTGPKKPLLSQSFIEIGDEYIIIRDLLLAKKTFEKANQICPRASIFYRLGLINLKLKNFHAALDNFQKAIGLDSEIPKAYYHMCRIHLSLDDMDAALEDYKELKSLDKSLADVLNRITDYSLE